MPLCRFCHALAQICLKYYDDLVHGFRIIAGYTGISEQF